MGEPLFDLLTRTALSRDDHFRLRDLAAKTGIIFLSTPFSREAADFLELVGVPAFKTGSGELTNVPFLRALAAFGLYCAKAIRARSAAQPVTFNIK